MAQGLVGALEQAWSDRQPVRGWIHHSHRGALYASAANVLRLAAAGARSSTTGVGAPEENGPVGRLMLTVTEEEGNLQEYRTLREAKAGLAYFPECGVQRETPVRGAGVPGAGRVRGC